MKVATVVGARPQFVKVAPVSRALAAAGWDEALIHTGQHFDPMMSDVFFDELDIAPPAHTLDIHGGTHAEMTARMLIGIEQVLLAERPDLVLVYGDTNSTLAGALVAAKLRVPLAHVEAGLRSFNRAMPEEINRVVTDHLSQILLCPTQVSLRNLETEGVVSGVHHVGDVMYDATLFARARAAGRSTIVDRLDLIPGRYAVATLHRAENTDDPVRLGEVMGYLADIAAQCPVVLPVHPRTSQALDRHGIAIAGVTACEPLSYLDMTALCSHAAMILTDSGGLQKEAYFHRVPCVTLREETEWVETVTAGWNRLWKQPDYARPQKEIDDYGDGQAATRVVQALVSELLPSADRP